MGTFSICGVCEASVPNPPWRAHASTEQEYMKLWGDGVPGFREHLDHLDADIRKMAAEREEEDRRWVEYVKGMVLPDE